MISPSSRVSETVGAVVIGRNEGRTLVECIRSLQPSVHTIVYVDSGSSDGSLEQARSLGACVVELDISRPFTAARARNAGVSKLVELAPDLEFVQVVDGDCTVVSGWIEAAAAALNNGPQTAIVSGRRRERRRGASVYNRLCDMEWDRASGEVDAVGGDALIRLSAFDEVSGYNAELIAGEEPEMCLRLRSAGWDVVRLDAEMTTHDARLERFSQWWQRSCRAGHAFAEGGFRAMQRHQRFRWHELRSILFWGLILPLCAAGPAVLTGGLSCLLGLGYLLLWYRIRRGRISSGDTRGDASLYAVFCVLGKFPELCGVLRFVFGTMRRRPATLIEYR